MRRGRERGGLDGDCIALHLNLLACIWGCYYILSIDRMGLGLGLGMALWFNCCILDLGRVAG